jgi:hypothetical protein
MEGGRQRAAEADGGCFVVQVQGVQVESGHGGV